MIMKLLRRLMRLFRKSERIDLVRDVKRYAKAYREGKGRI